MQTNRLTEKEKARIIQVCNQEENRSLAPSQIVGKGEAPATPSPLPRGGQFPPFTDVPVSGIGRLRPEYPLRGVICFDLRRLMIEVGQAQ